MNRRLIGNAGEEYAARLYKKLGYEILARNYTVRGGELDIVAQKDGEIVFIEVRLRAIGGLVSAGESVTAVKRRRVLLAAQTYLMQHPSSLQPRFDVVALEAQNGAIIGCERIENAFGGDL